MWLFDRVRTIPDIARYWGAVTPDKVALIDGATTRTYAELDRRSDGLAAHMARAGIRAGSSIGFLGRNSAEFFEVWFAAGKIACPIAPFNWRSPVEELLVLIDDAAPPVIFVSDEFYGVLNQVLARAQSKFEIVRFGADRDEMDRRAETAVVPDALTTARLSDVALLTYTSGTTGRPKGVQATHEAFQYSFLCTVQEPGLTLNSSDIVLMAMPNFHLGGSWVCLSALYYGGAISIIPAFEPTLFIEALRRDRPTILPLVPTAIQLMVTKFDLRESDCDCVRSILYFGSPIGRELMNTALKKLRCEFSQLYGTTEAYFLTILNHQQHITGSDQRLSSCGAALPLVSMKVVGSDDKEVPNGTIGEIAVRTPMMFNGYYRQPELTKDVLRGGWYHTGDLGWRDDEGFHHIVDRAKDMIISGGENVYSAEVEAALLKHPSVVSLAVIGVPDPQWGEKVIALVVLAPKLQVSEAELKEHCRKYVAGYKVPKEIRFETALPLTPTGKVQKAVLRKRFREQS